MKIAVQNDDSAQLKVVCALLRSSGYTILHFGNDQEIPETADMLILDNSAKHEIIQQIRNKSQLPILLITAQVKPESIVESLAVGANDYLIRPVRKEDLLARVGTLLRQFYPTQFIEKRQEFGHYIFEEHHCRVQFPGHETLLTKMEFDLALFLFNNIDRPLSRSYLLESIWEHENDVQSRALDTHISRVRNKLQLRPENGYRLAPVYGYGYRLEHYVNSTIMK